MLAALHGPDAVQGALISFLEAVTAFWIDAGELKRDQAAGALGGSDLADVRMGLPKQRAVISDRLGELAELMSNQVTGARS